MKALFSTHAQTPVRKQGIGLSIANVTALIKTGMAVMMGCFFLLGCAGEPPQTAAQQANADLQKLLEADNVSLSAIHAASRRLLVMQDWYGHWQAELHLCQHQWLRAPREQACRQALAALAMLEYTPQSHKLGTPSFVTYLSAHLGTGDPVYLSHAKGYATTPAQREVWQQVHQDFAQAMTVSADHDAVIRAESLYRRGKQQSDAALVRQALAAFESLGNAQKQADSHFLLARLYWQQGRNNQAVQHAQRSLLLNGAAGNRFAEHSVRGWLDAHASR